MAAGVLVKGEADIPRFITGKSQRKHSKPFAIWIARMIGNALRAASWLRDLASRRSGRLDGCGQPVFRLFLVQRL